MENEQLERKMEFIIDTLAQVAVNDQKHGIGLSRMERIMKLMVRAGRREREHRRETNAQFDGQFSRVNQALAELAEARNVRRRRSPILTASLMRSLTLFVNGQMVRKNRL